jgi:hypothetical protein
MTLSKGKRLAQPPVSALTLSGGRTRSGFYLCTLLPNGVRWREVVLLSLAIGADIFGRHQPGIVTKRCEFAAQVMCADAGFHADQARRYIGEPRFHLATRPLLPQHDGAARIVAHDVERVLADIPCQLRLLAGQEHGRTIPLRPLTPAALSRRPC